MSPQLYNPLGSSWKQGHSSGDRSLLCSCLCLWIFLASFSGQRKPRYWQQHAQGCMRSGCIRGCPDLNPVGTRNSPRQHQRLPNGEPQALVARTQLCHGLTGEDPAQRGCVPNRPSAPVLPRIAPLGCWALNTERSTRPPEGLPAQPWALQGGSLCPEHHPTCTRSPPCVTPLLLLDCRRPQSRGSASCDR